MEFKEGMRVRKTKASIESLNIWRTLKQRMPYLLCPCSIKESEALLVTDVLNDRYILVQYENSPTKLSVVYKGDLAVRH